MSCSHISFGKAKLARKTRSGSSGCDTRRYYRAALPPVNTAGERVVVHFATTDDVAWGQGRWASLLPAPASLKLAAFGERRGRSGHAPASLKLAAFGGGSRLAHANRPSQHPSFAMEVLGGADARSCGMVAAKRPSSPFVTHMLAAARRSATAGGVEPSNGVIVWAPVLSTSGFVS
jgi:hypothetical protein